MYTHTHTLTHILMRLAHYVVAYLFCGESADPLVCCTKRGQSLFLLHCCLIEGTDSFPPLITSRQAGGGKPWDMATFSLLRQPIMGVNWNSWVELFAGSAQWGDSFQEAQCPTLFYHLFWLSELKLCLLCCFRVTLSTNTWSYTV